MEYLKRFNETQFYDDKGVYIEPVASSSDFSKYIDNQEELEFDSNEFWDNMDMWEEGKLSSRYSVDWCEKVIDGTAGKYWENKRKYYPVILSLMKQYQLTTIRFACDW